ncbi:MAG: beta-ketoacyl-[acyl-carrier-protein] synthase family protein [Gammaproteobacteria bacterium]|nr:beta-ketoacyl-[acyl-carrier-protein] synthase family protein [Gammaproteobacteria bacterium]
MKAMTPMAITAKTIVNSCGVGEASTIEALRNNSSGLKQQAYEGLNFDTWLGTVNEVEFIEIEPQLKRYNCRNNRLAQLALKTDSFHAFVKSAKLRYGAERVGVFVGTSTSGIAETEDAYSHMHHHDTFPDNFDLLYTHNMSSLQRYVQHSLGLNGPGHTISTACSSSAKVFAAAYRHIVTGQCDAAIVGGVDSLCMSTLYGFKSLQLVSEEICRPFDANRNGINIGEAAGFILLEPVKFGHGKVKFKGYGESSDAYHMSTPHPEGDGAVAAMNDAMTRASLNASEIEYINLHGTATRNNDQAEARSLFRVFGDKVVCSSTKGFTGHTLGAAGITESIISILALEQNILPGNLNMHSWDETLRIKPLEVTTKCSVENVMTNNFGFGGNNCSLIFGW